MSESTTATAPNKRKEGFKKGSGCFTCRICKKQTRATNGSENDAALIHLCTKCYDEAGWENSHVDELHEAGSQPECPLCRAHNQAAADAKAAAPVAQPPKERERPHYWLHYGGSHAAIIAPDGSTLLRVPQGEVAKKRNDLPDPPTPEQLDTLVGTLNDLLAAARFSLSVHKAQGLWDLSEKMAAEKLQAAIARAEGGA